MAPSAGSCTPPVSHARAPMDGGSSGERRPTSLPLPRRESWRRCGPARCSCSACRCLLAATAPCTAAIAGPRTAAEAAPVCPRCPASPFVCRPGRPPPAREAAGGGCVGHLRDHLCLPCWPWGRGGGGALVDGAGWERIGTGGGEAEARTRHRRPVEPQRRCRPWRSRQSWRGATRQATQGR
jgi:hypothetical protein